MKAPIGKPVLSKSLLMANTVALFLMIPACGEPDRPTTTIHDAIAIDNIDEVKRHIHWRSDLNELDENAHSPLFSSTLLCRPSIFNALTVAGADLGNDPKRHRFLAEAITGCPQLVEPLVRKGVDINAKDSEGSSPLLLAILANSPNSVMTLIKAGADATEADDNFEITLLHEAAAKGYGDIVQLLLDKGADPSRATAGESSFAGFTPLHYAAQSGDMATVSILLQAGASVNAESLHLSSPLHVAAKGGRNSRKHVQVVRYLIENGANVKAVSKGLEYSGTPLHVASREGHPQTIKLLIDSGADVNALGPETAGFTPLHGAASSGYVAALEILVAAGSDSNRQAENEYGMTPLHLAVANRNMGIVERLVSLGVDIDSRAGPYGRTSLHEVVSRADLDGVDPNNLAIVEQLISLGADIEASDKFGEGPLLESVSYTIDIRLIELLIRKGANVNIKTNEGMTALHSALQWGRADIAMVLIDNGADINAKTNRGVTPLHNAHYSYNLNKDVIKLLIDRGADPNSIDKDGKKPRDRM